MEETTHRRGPLTRCYYSKRVMGGSWEKTRRLGLRQSRECALPFPLPSTSPPAPAALLLCPHIFQRLPELNQSRCSCHSRRGDKVTSHEGEEQKVEGLIKVAPVFSVVRFTIMSTHNKCHKFVKDHIMISRQITLSPRKWKASDRKSENPRISSTHSCLHSRITIKVVIY